MNKHLLIYNIKSNLKMFIAFLAITLMYSTVAISMFDPETSEAMQQFIDVLPEAMINMMGFNSFGTELTGYLAAYLYGFILFIFPMIFIVMLTSKLIAKQIDSTAIAYILTTPNSRKRIIITQAVSIIINIVSLVVINTLIVIVISWILFPGLLMIGKYIGLNLVLIGILLITSSLVFIISIAIDDYSKSIGLSSLLVGYLFIMNMTKNISEELDFLKYTTFLSILNTDSIFNSPNYILVSTLFSIIISIILFFFGIIYFDKKNLTI